MGSVARTVARPWHMFDDAVARTTVGSTIRAAAQRADDAILQTARNVTGRTTTRGFATRLDPYSVTEPWVAPRPTIPRNAAQPLPSPQNVANGPRLNEQLFLEEAAGVFDDAGALRPSVIRSSDRIIEGADLGNTQVVKALTADGSNIADWGKYVTQSFGGSRPYTVHFYFNPVTGRANYTIDYKVVFGGSP